VCRNCHSGPGFVDPEVFAINAREHSLRVDTSPDLPALKREEVRKRTERAVENKNSGALASLLLEAGHAWDDVDPITPHACVAMARYLLGVENA
jgi:hypothetical protein